LPDKTKSNYPTNQYFQQPDHLTPTFGINIQEIKMLRNKTIIKKVIQAIEEDVLEGDVFDLVRVIEMLLGYEVPRQLILEYIGEEK